MSGPADRSGRARWCSERCRKFDCGDVHAALGNVTLSAVDDKIGACRQVEHTDAPGTKSKPGIR